MSSVVDADHIERDTDASEEVDLLTLLLPDATLPKTHRRCAFAYNAALLAGWVKQSSPACAAASVAGAYNALTGQPRSSKDALCQPDLVTIFEAILDDRLRQANTRLASAIGAPVEPLLEGIESELAAAGQPLDQKWPKGAKRKAVMAAVRRLADAGGAPVYTRLQAYFASAEANEEDGGDAGEEDDADGGNGGEDVSETLVEFVGMDDGEQATASSTWKKHLMLYLKNYAGLLKLRRERPSTGFFGNWGIVAAARRLSETHNLALQARLFMGRAARGLSLDAKLSLKDNEEAITQQWDVLRAAVLREDTVIIFHLKNHYAPVYALREWVTAEDETVRQLLTARKGQRPSTWIDFTEAREIMLKWAGYKMIALQKR